MRRSQNSEGQKHVIALLLCLALSAVAKPTQQPLEPTISAREAEILAEAAELGATNTEEAIALLNKQNPEKASAAIDFAIANFQFQTEQYEAAAAAYRNAIAKLPTFLSAHKNLARVYLLDGKDNDAIAVCQWLVEEGLADADALLLFGHALVGQESWVAAETAYRQALLLKTDSSDAQSGLARCLISQERYHEARSLLRTMLKNNPTRSEFWSLLANLNVSLNETVAAIHVLETARRMNCCNGSMLGLLGDLYLNAGRPEDAVSSYEAALGAGWDDKNHLIRATEGMLHLGDAKGAEAMLTQAEKALAPEVRDSFELRRLKAELSALKGDLSGAITAFQSLTERDPLNGKVLLRLGDLLHEQGELGRAELNYERAGRLSATRVDALIKRAQLAVQRERYEEAVELLEAAEAIESRPHVARYLTQVRRLVRQ
jgi:tetratricopeptide (TPR) repeat protein